MSLIWVMFSSLTEEGAMHLMGSNALIPTNTAMTGEAHGKTRVAGTCRAQSFGQTLLYKSTCQ